MDEWLCVYVTWKPQACLDVHVECSGRTARVWVRTVGGPIDPERPPCKTQRQAAPSRFNQQDTTRSLVRTRGQNFVIIDGLFERPLILYVTPSHPLSGQQTTTSEGLILWHTETPMTSADWRHLLLTKP